MTKVMLDTIALSLHNVPKDAEVVGSYMTGGVGIQATRNQMAACHAKSYVLIDQAQTENSASFWAAELDVENGALTFATAAQAAHDRLVYGNLTTYIYVATSNLGSIQHAVSAFAGLSARVLYRVANWSLNEAGAAKLISGQVVGCQWASPTSNPDTIVPGGAMTLREANIDVSVVNDAYGWPLP